MGGIAPFLLRVVNVHRAGEHDEVWQDNGDPVPCVKFDILGEGSGLRVAPVEVCDLGESIHRRTLPMLPRNPATTFTGLPVVGLRAIADRSMTSPRLIA